MTRVQASIPDHTRVDKKEEKALEFDLFSAEYFTAALAKPALENLWKSSSASLIFPMNARP